ncbi:pCP2475L [African swine fever virus]|uniref:PCP2475L n=1 Tax=African swine fever virus TaxID=10497 RepID=A0A894KPP0_ASF|nr:pCP2475L [African swine fever virus]
MYNPNIAIILFICEGLTGSCVGEPILCIAGVYIVVRTVEHISALREFYVYTQSYYSLYICIIYYIAYAASVKAILSDLYYGGLLYSNSHLFIDGPGSFFPILFRVIRVHTIFRICNGMSHISTCHTNGCSCNSSCATTQPSWNITNISFQSFYKCSTIICEVRTGCHYIGRYVYNIGHIPLCRFIISLYYLSGMWNRDSMSITNVAYLCSHCCGRIILYYFYHCIGLPNISYTIIYGIYPSSVLLCPVLCGCNVLRGWIVLYFRSLYHVFNFSSHTYKLLSICTYIRYMLVFINIISYNSKFLWYSYGTDKFMYSLFVVFCYGLPPLFTSTLYTCGQTRACFIILKLCGVQTSKYHFITNLVGKKLTTAHVQRIISSTNACHISSTALAHQFVSILGVTDCNIRVYTKFYHIFSSVHGGTIWNVYYLCNIWLRSRGVYRSYLFGRNAVHTTSNFFKTILILVYIGKWYTSHQRIYIVTYIIHIKQVIYALALSITAKSACLAFRRYYFVYMFVLLLLVCAFHEGNHVLQCFTKRIHCIHPYSRCYITFIVSVLAITIISTKSIFIVHHHCFTTTDIYDISKSLYTVGIQVFKSRGSILFASNHCFIIFFHVMLYSGHICELYRIISQYFSCAVYYFILGGAAFKVWVQKRIIYLIILYSYVTQILQRKCKWHTRLLIVSGHILLYAVFFCFKIHGMVGMLVQDFHGRVCQSVGASIVPVDHCDQSLSHNIARIILCVSYGHMRIIGTKYAANSPQGRLSDGYPCHTNIIIIIILYIGIIIGPQEPHQITTSQLDICVLYVLFYKLPLSITNIIHFVIYWKIGSIFFFTIYTNFCYSTNTMLSQALAVTILIMPLQHATQGQKEHRLFCGVAPMAKGDVITCYVGMCVPQLHHRLATVPVGECIVTITIYFSAGSVIQPGNVRGYKLVIHHHHTTIILYTILCSIYAISSKVVCGIIVVGIRSGRHIVPVPTSIFLLGIVGTNTITESTVSYYHLLYTESRVILQSIVQYESTVYSSILFKALRGLGIVIYLYITCISSLYPTSKLQYIIRFCTQDVRFIIVLVISLQAQFTARKWPSPGISGWFIMLVNQMFFQPVQCARIGSIFVLLYIVFINMWAYKITKILTVGHYRINYGNATCTIYVHLCGTTFGKANLYHFVTTGGHFEDIGQQELHVSLFVYQISCGYFLLRTNSSTSRNTHIWYNPGKKSFCTYISVLGCSRFGTTIRIHPTKPRIICLINQSWISILRDGSVFSSEPVNTIGSVHVGGLRFSYPFNVAFLYRIYIYTFIVITKVIMEYVYTTQYVTTCIIGFMQQKYFVIICICQRLRALYMFCNNLYFVSVVLFVFIVTLANVFLVRNFAQFLLYAGIFKHLAMLFPIFLYQVPLGVGLQHSCLDIHRVYIVYCRAPLGGGLGCRTIIPIGGKYLRGLCIPVLIRKNGVLGLFHHSEVIHTSRFLHNALQFFPFGACIVTESAVYFIYKMDMRFFGCFLFAILYVTVLVYVVYFFVMLSNFGFCVLTNIIMLNTPHTDIANMSCEDSFQLRKHRDLYIFISAGKQLLLQLSEAGKAEVQLRCLGNYLGLYLVGTSQYHTCGYTFVHRLRPFKHIIYAYYNANLTGHTFQHAGAEDVLGFPAGCYGVVISHSTEVHPLCRFLGSSCKRYPLPSNFCLFYIFMSHGKRRMLHIFKQGFIHLQGRHGHHLPQLLSPKHVSNPGKSIVVIFMRLQVGKRTPDMVANVFTLACSVGTEGTNASALLDFSRNFFVLLARRSIIRTDVGVVTCGGGKTFKDLCKRVPCCLGVPSSYIAHAIQHLLDCLYTIYVVYKRFGIVFTIQVYPFQSSIQPAFYVILQLDGAYSCLPVFFLGTSRVWAHVSSGKIYSRRIIARIFFRIQLHVASRNTISENTGILFLVRLQLLFVMRYIGVYLGHILLLHTSIICLVVVNLRPRGLAVSKLFNCASSTAYPCALAVLPASVLFLHNIGIQINILQYARAGVIQIFTITVDFTLLLYNIFIKHILCYKSFAFFSCGCVGVQADTTYIKRDGAHIIIARKSISKPRYVRRYGNFFIKFVAYFFHIFQKVVIRLCTFVQKFHVDVLSIQPLRFNPPIYWRFLLVTPLFGTTVLKDFMAFITSLSQYVHGFFKLGNVFCGDKATISFVVKLLVKLRPVFALQVLFNLVSYFLESLIIFICNRCGNAYITKCVRKYFSKIFGSYDTICVIYKLIIIHLIRLQFIKFLLGGSYNIVNTIRYNVVLQVLFIYKSTIYCFNHGVCIIVFFIGSCFGYLRHHALVQLFIGIVYQLVVFKCIFYTAVYIKIFRAQSMCYGVVVQNYLSTYTGGPIGGIYVLILSYINIFLVIGVCNHFTDGLLFFRIFYKGGTGSRIGQLFFVIFTNIFDGLLCVYFVPYFGNRPVIPLYIPQLCFTRYGVYVLFFVVLYRIFVPPAITISSPCKRTSLSLYMFLYLRIYICFCCRRWSTTGCRSTVT